MTPARFQTIEQIYRKALEQQPDKIEAFLGEACGGDEVLRRKVEALLSSRQQANGFMEDSAIGLAARIIQNAETESLVGCTIGHYKISESIGSGGMGEVYLATDIVAGRRAALKLLPLRFTGDAERLKRFEQEARAVVGLNHPNIVTVYEIGEANSIHYIASELIDGETLRDRLARGPMQLSEALDVAIQVTTALATAHQAGIVHRDIKPENIMLRPDGYAKVLDFGIAKLAESTFAEAAACAEPAPLAQTNLGSVLGTACYMSPEQACGAQIDKRTDVWSLGVVLYEMITQHEPFTGDTIGEVSSAILHQEAPQLTNSIPRAPAQLQQIIRKTLRKNRDERYQNAHELLDALRDFRRKLEAKSERAAAPLWLRWARSPATVALILATAALAVALRLNGNRTTTSSVPPDKSIAVLPFENLSKGEENASFAGGVQDEILTNLAKVADLKIISRTSVMKYKSGLEQNLREIANTLGVSHVVEGSVQRSGGRVRVNVQLIDARNDAHVWAEHYDRDVADIFAIQSEIAKQIADQLRARLSEAEKAAIEERPTADLMAYAYYTKAKEIKMYDNWEGAEKSAKLRVELLEKATQRDPNFALAYCALAKAQVALQATTEDPDQKYLELARRAAEAALRLRPDLGEPHLELARYFFWAGVSTNDYDRARDELAIVRQKSPNNAEALMIDGQIGRHQNRWGASIAKLQKADELDPRNDEIAYDLWRIYFEMRRYSEAEQLATKQAANSNVENPSITERLAEIKMAQGDPVAAQSLLERVPLEFNPSAYIWAARFKAALYLRDYDAAERVIAATPAKGRDLVFEGPSGWAYGQIARARGDAQKAVAAFSDARQKAEANGGKKPRDPAYFSEIARFDAGLGQKEAATAEALRAVALMPIANESLNGPVHVTNLALVYAWTGERELALDQLEKVATIPAGPTYGDLLLNPCWDDLRSDPRFDKIVAAAKAASK